MTPTAPAAMAAPPGRPDGGWTLGGRFMLRVAGLPVEAVRALRSPAARAWADEVLERERALRRGGAQLSDRLHGLVADLGDERSRRRLLALRREVFNVRVPADPEGVTELLHALDARLAREAAAWIGQRRALQAALAGGGPLLAEETARTRAELRRLAGADRLRLGLLLASPTLEGRLDAYAGDTSPRPGKRTRKAERSLLAYLYRTACKTSPFSTFTGVALGEFGGGGPEIEVAGEWTSHPRLNTVVLARLAELVLADPARRADLPVGPASGWGHDEDRVRYVRRWVTAGDDGAAVTFDAVSDRLFFLRRSGTLDRMLALFAQRPTVRYGELVAWLSAEQGAPPQECERYLAALLHLGMVRVPVLAVDVHSADPLQSFRGALLALDRPWARALADGLAEPARLVGRYAAADADGRRALLAQLRRRLHALQEDLGAPAATLPQTLLYEDVRAEPVRCGRDGGWVESLRSVERVLPAFDLTLPQRLTFKGFFTARHGRGGRCTDLLKLVHDFHEDFFDQYLSFTARRRPYDDEGAYVPEPNWLGLPQIAALDRARTEFTARMRQAAGRAGGADEGVRGGEAAAHEVVLDDEAVAAVARELAPVRGDFVPSAHFVQLAHRPDGSPDRERGPLAVLNRSYSGLSFPFSRFTHAQEGLAEALREHNRRVRPDGAVFAEITGGAVTTNLNLHGRLTDHQIVCPGETSSVPEEDRIHLDDLSLEHDPDADRLVLRSARLGREVIPVYLGYLVPLALPEIPRTLLLLSPTSMAPLDVWGGVPAGPARDGVVSRPRVRHGDVVLSRRSWTVRAGALPRRGGSGDGDGDGDAAWFLGWQRWRAAHGLPGQVFATVSEEGGRGAAGAKPQYLDFDSPLSLTAFEGLLKGDGARVVLREMLPGEDALHVRSAAGTHVAELAVETYTARAPREARP